MKLSKAYVICFALLACLMSACQAVPQNAIEAMNLQVVSERQKNNQEKLDQELKSQEQKFALFRSYKRASEMADAVLQDTEYTAPNQPLTFTREQRHSTTIKVDGQCTITVEQ